MDPLMTEDISEPYKLMNKFIVSLFTISGLGLAFYLGHTLSRSTLGIYLLIGFIVGFMLGSVFVILFRK